VIVAIFFHIPGALQPFSDGRRTIQIEAAPCSLREALEKLFSSHPGLRDRIWTEQSTVREHINLFVGHEDVRYLNGLETRLTDAAEILIVPAVSGGALLHFIPR
jgi:molybdopterin synthase sulfur carrier subunit